ncbi:MAG TPA: hypothetical protein VG294_17030 [Solirubrobacteraceae bacterium]|jgi:hypothetical protein|nr:hypothetical protein [Solirubrobacteraceae bacterium]
MTQAADLRARLNYPSGEAIWQTINMIKGSGTSKPWKQAFKDAGPR